MEVGGTSMEAMRGASFAGSSPPSLGREQATVGVDVDAERTSPRNHVCEDVYDYIRHD